MGTVRICNGGYTFFYDSKFELETYEYTFELDGKSADESIFRLFSNTFISSDIRAFKDVKRRNVGMIGGDVPVYDTAEREYDSRECMYVTEENGWLTGIMIRRGYKIGSAYLLMNVRFGDKRTKYLMGLLGIRDDMQKKGEYALPGYF